MHRRQNHRLDVGFGREIGIERRGLATARTDLLHHCFGGGNVLVDHHHGSALGSEQPRGRLADTARRTGDDHDLALHQSEPEGKRRAHHLARLFAHQRNAEGSGIERTRGIGRRVGHGSHRSCRRTTQSAFLADGVLCQNVVVTTRIVLGTCHHDCPDSCGWQVTVEDGRAVSMRGNPDHPYSQGELCPKVNRFLDRVYSPDRILTPLIRTGAKGDAQFRAATWDEALAHVADRVGEIVRTWGGQAVVPWGDAGTQGSLMMNSLDRRFFARLGSSVQVDSLCGATALSGTAAALGSPLTCDPLDVRHADLILLWGTNTRLTNRHLWPFIEEARRNQGARVVVIDPVRTITADAADEFIQPLPGTDVALMLAMMHVLVRDDLVDHDYVQRHTSGFDELTRHVADWTPQRAAAITGVDASVIEQLARVYGTTTKSFIRTLIGAEHREHGAQFFRTLVCLPALTGAWKYKGGGFSRSVGSYNNAFLDDDSFSAPHLAAGKPRRPISMNRIGRALTDANLDPPVKALFVYNGNPVATAPEAATIMRGLRRDDLFTVVSEQFMTDTARFADVIFPATTQIEQNDVVTAWGHLYLGFNHKAIEPLGESVPNTELWRRLARAMGFTEPELFESDEALLAKYLAKIDADVLRRDAVVHLPLPDDLRPYADGGFATPSGTFEFANSGLESLGHGRLPEYRQPVEGPGGPTSTKYPLVLMSPKTHQRFLNSSYSHLADHAGPEGEMYCELTQADAAARAISDGDRVRVFNDRGSIDVVARVSDRPRTREGMAIVPFGWTWSRTRDKNTVNVLTSDAPADWGGGVAFYDTLVQVERVG
ncbi:MAG: molybdopterin oxidoreductase family protein [Actinobacteria bacterium]|nr:molybdopterin oxidoreductase family protein [Actinomycetota bacterium]